MDGRLPGDGGPQAQAGGFEGMARGFMGRLRGPWGCVFALLACTCLLPVVIVMFIFNFAKLRAMWKAQREAERGMPHPPGGGGFGGGPRVVGAGPGARDAFSQAVSARAAAMLARAMAIDESFTRDEALQAGVAAGAGMSPADILDEAIRRGWIAERGDGRLHVTDRGRAEADRL